MPALAHLPSPFLRPNRIPIWTDSGGQVRARGSVRGSAASESSWSEARLLVSIRCEDRNSRPNESIALLGAGEALTHKSELVYPVARSGFQSAALRA